MSIESIEEDSDFLSEELNEKSLQNFKCYGKTSDNYDDGCNNFSKSDLNLYKAAPKEGIFQDASSENSSFVELVPDLDKMNSSILKNTKSFPIKSEICDSNYGSEMLDSLASNIFSETSKTIPNALLHRSESTTFDDDILNKMESIDSVFDTSETENKETSGDCIEDLTCPKLSHYQNELYQKKMKIIIDALETGNVADLRTAAIEEYGLLTDDIRKKVWPILVGINIVETSPRPCLEEIKAHPYYDQVVMDVNRSLKRFPPSIREAQRLTMLQQLVILIMRVLCQHPEMHYYQGYHDICITFLLVLGEEIAFHVVEKLSCTHLNVFMEKDMAPTIHLLEYMYLLIGKRNLLLKTFMLSSEVGVAYCLSWLITWFGHVLNDYDNVVRFFDFFLVSHPWMPMYLTAAIVLHREEEVLQQECDMASVHSLLSDVPDNLPFEDLLKESVKLFNEYKPNALSKERPYVKKSVSKKSRWKLIESVSNTIKSAVPVRNMTIPIVVAAAVVITALIYQAYNN